jgi:hypothetical protein
MMRMMTMMTTTTMMMMMMMMMMMRNLVRDIFGRSSIKIVNFGSIH